MRYFFVCIAAAVSFAAAPAVSQAQTTGPAVAPADEYFGRLSQSVLEIRNRLDAFDRKTDADARNVDAVGALDNVEEAVMEWQHKYPADPWVIDAMARVVKDYARASAGSDPRAAAVLATLLAVYPNTTEASSALLALAQAVVPAPSDLASARPSAADITGDVVDGTTGAPIGGAIVMVAANHESTDLSAASYATTGADGSFAVKDVPLGTEYIVVQPPHDSPYAPYHGVVDADAGTAHAGIIRLAIR